MQVDKNIIKIRKHNRKTGTDAEGNIDNGINRNIYFIYFFPALLRYN